jgi:protein TonB
MDATKVLSADILDILFERMNKDYGAYQLRKGYNQRLKKALSITAALALLAIGGMEASQWYAHYRLLHTPIVREVSLTNVADPPPVKVTPPALPKPAPAPRMAITRVTVLNIVDNPRPDRILKNNADLDNVTIGTTDQQGIKDPSIVNPPKTDVDSKVVAGPAPDDDHVFMKVEMEATFPGGDAAWIAYVRKTVTEHMDELQEDGKSGSVDVQFIVDKTGAVSDVEALNMQGTKLAEIAVNAIRRGPNWKPAQQNGRFVKAFRRQKITFQMPED